MFDEEARKCWNKFFVRTIKEHKAEHKAEPKRIAHHLEGFSIPLIGIGQLEEDEGEDRPMVLIEFKNHTNYFVGHLQSTEEGLWFLDIGVTPTPMGAVYPEGELTFDAGQVKFAMVVTRESMNSMAEQIIANMAQRGGIDPSNIAKGGGFS